MRVPTKLELRCKICGWAPPSRMTMGVVQAHFETEHDSDETDMDMVPVCPCGASMVFTESRPTSARIVTDDYHGGVKDYWTCAADGNEAVVKRRV